MGPVRAAAVAIVAAALSAPDARAGSCCGTTGGVVPVWVTPSERTVIGASFGLSGAVGRWDASGRVQGTSLAESVQTWTLAAGWRFARPAQVFVSVPAVATVREAPTLRGTGGGVGDVRAGLGLDPWRERDAASDPRRLPVPVLLLGVRLPTGRDTLAARAPLEADVTGLPGTALTLGVRVERTVDPVPWYLSAEVDAGVVPPATTAATGGVARTSIQPVLRMTAGIGRHLTSRRTLMVTLTHAEALRAVGGRPARTAWTTLGATALFGGLGGPRGWFGWTADLPVPGLGAERPIALGLVVGAAWGR